MKKHIDTATALQKVLATLIDTLNEPSFPTVFLESVNAITPFDSAVVMVYGMDTRPTVIHDALAKDYSCAFYDKYLTGAFLLCPLYKTFRAQKQGFFSIQDVAPNGFFNSEYYKNYHIYSGLIDEIFYLKHLNPNLAVVISIARTTEQEPFLPTEIDTLRLYEASFISLIAKHWEQLGTSPYSFSDYLQQAFENFGTSVLSHREKQTIDCILQGDSSKSAAKSLGITPETERSYRKVIYSKLGVGSQAELYNLFFKSLDYADQANGQDPLEFIVNHH